GLLAVLAHHDAVLLVAEPGGAEPDRTLLTVQVSARLEHRERVIDRAAVGERALGGPVIEDDAELGEVTTDVREHLGERVLEHLAKTVRAEQRAGPRDERIAVGV